MLKSIALVAALLLPPAGAVAQEQTFQDRPGDAYELQLRSESSSESGDGSTGSSRSGGSMVERVVAVREDGLELEFDFSAGASAADRARDWQLPARVLLRPDGSLVLLNEDDIRVRIDEWLTLGQIPREACGRWIFTWTAFKIECDPQSVLQTLEAYILRPQNLREGTQYREVGALAAVPFTTSPSDFGGLTYTAEAQVDAASVRLARAETDVVVAEMIGGDPIVLEDALEALMAERISGTITTTFQTDVLGRVVRRTRVMILETLDGEGVLSQETRTLTVDRRPVSGGS